MEDGLKNEYIQMNAKLKAKINAVCIVDRESKLPIIQHEIDKSWVFNFKVILLNGADLNNTSELMWEMIRPFGKVQVGGLETAAIGLIAGIVLKSAQDNTPINGFYIRKSRKKNDLQNIVEGSITDDSIILIDDILNEGKSMIRQIELLEQMNKRVVAIISVVRFRESDFYEYFHKKNIEVLSLFTLDDFPATGGVKIFKKNISNNALIKLDMPYSITWRFTSPHPEYSLVVSKSAPILDDEYIYFGSDSGTIWALSQNDGSVIWQFKCLFGAGKKMILSTPALYKNILYIGSYDGTFYALDKKTGKKIWSYMDADWVGSSPCVSGELQKVFVGLEFGLWHKQGALVALDVLTGALSWKYPIDTLVHSSPKYTKKYNLVIVGSSSGTVYACNASNGNLIWKFETGAAVRAGFAIDEHRGVVAFGSEDHFIYALDIKTGLLMSKVETLEALNSTPIIINNYLYIGGLDKKIYCVDIKTGEIIWNRWSNGRIFASPISVGNSIFIGSNDGRLYELDAMTGKEISFFQVTERIVNAIAYNSTTNTIFIPTFANELYCIERT